jgi:CYTH domain-containing protein
LVIIKNELGEPFSGKINRAVSALARLLGEPEPLEAERKFLVNNFTLAQLPVHAVPCDIVQTYLVGAPGKTERVRARGQNNYFVYSHTIKEFVAAGVAIERERMLTRSEYDNFLIRRNRTRVDIHKTRYCFVYGGHYCELDVFHTGRRVGEVHLEIEVARSDMLAKLDLPPFLQIDREVTHEKGFSNFDMSTPAVAA